MSVMRYLHDENYGNNQIQESVGRLRALLTTCLMEDTYGRILNH